MGEPAVDDRGKRVKLVFVGGYPARLWSMVSHMPIDVHRKLRTHLENGMTGLTWPSVVVGGVLIALWTLVAVVLGPYLQKLMKPSIGEFTAMFLTNFVPQIAAIAGVTVWGARRLNRRLIEGAVKLGHCPSCGYLLKSLPIDADGCSTCPECGCGWRPRS